MNEYKMECCGKVYTKYRWYSKHLLNHHIDEDVWTMKDGFEILVSKMTTQHIENAKRMMGRAQTSFVMAGCIFTEDATQDTLDSQEDECEYWIEIFDNELKRRA